MKLTVQRENVLFKGGHFAIWNYNVIDIVISSKTLMDLHSDDWKNVECQLRGQYLFEDHWKRGLEVESIRISSYLQFLLSENNVWLAYFCRIALFNFSDKFVHYSVVFLVVSWKIVTCAVVEKDKLLISKSKVGFAVVLCSFLWDKN